MIRHWDSTSDGSCHSVVGVFGTYVLGWFQLVTSMSMHGNTPFVCVFLLFESHVGLYDVHWRIILFLVLFFFFLVCSVGSWRYDVK